MRDDELLGNTLAFVEALGLLLKENTGIVINVTPEMKKYRADDGAEKLIVYYMNESIYAQKLEVDVAYGSIVNVFDAAKVSLN